MIQMNLFTKQKETQTYKMNLWLPGEGILREFETVTYTCCIYSPWGLLCSSWNSAQCCVEVQQGWEGGWGKKGHMYIYGCIPLLSTWNHHSIGNLCVCVCVCVCVCARLLSHVQLFAAPWTVVSQAPLSMESFRHAGEGCHSLLEGVFPTRGVHPHSCITSTGRWTLDHRTTWEALLTGCTPTQNKKLKRKKKLKKNRENVYFFQAKSVIK